MGPNDGAAPEPARDAGPAAPTHHLQGAIDHAPFGLGFATAGLWLTYANPRWLELARFDGPLPASPETMLGLVHPDDQRLVALAFLRSHRTGELARVRVRVPIPDGGFSHVMLSISAVPGDDDIAYAIGLGDVTEVVDALEEVRRSEQRFRSIAGELPIGVYRADPDGALIWANQRMRDLGEYYGAADGVSVYRFLHPDDLEEVQELVRSAIRAKAPFEAQHRLMTDDGQVKWVISRSSPICDEGGRIVEHVGSIEDVTELHLRSVGLAHRASHDPLTGLPNRSNIVDLVRTLAGARPDADHVGIVFLDLDGFKAVNDAHGHQAGDEVLVEVGRRLAAVIRQGDTVGRYGGDEFVVVCPGVEDPDVLDAVARRIQDAIAAEPICADDHLHRIEASVGTAIGPGGGSVEDLLHRADLAMYEAKRKRA